MTKNILLFGTVIVAGYFTFSAFGPKQDAQKAEIAAMVTAKLNDLRAEKTQECDARVATESKKRYDEAMAAAPVIEPSILSKGTPSKKITKKGSKGPKVDPLPQTGAPKDPQKQRGGAAQEGNVEKQKERAGSVQQGTQQTPEQQKKRGGAVKEGGGK